MDARRAMNWEETANAIVGAVRFGRGRAFLSSPLTTGGTMSLLIQTGNQARPQALDTLVGSIPAYSIELPDVGVVQHLAVNAGETGEIVRLDHHITFHRAGQPMLYSRHDGETLAPVPMRAGLVHVRPAHAPHSSVWDARCELSVVALTPRFVSRCAWDLFKRDLTRANLRSSIAISDPFLWCLGTKLDELARLPDPPLVFMDEVATSIAMHLLLTTGAEPVMTASRALSRAAIRRISDHVDANLTQEIRLADLALICGLSPFHFARQFKREVGTSPARYIRLRRMQEARRLLVETKLNIDHIAARVGYHDASAFRRAFISEQGVSPSRFRRQAF